jgi:hypothetical protein
MTAARVTNLDDLTDSAYDVAEIRQHSRNLNHVPIIDINPRATPGLKQELAQEAKRQRQVGHRMAEDVRWGERSTAERVNAALKDNHGGRTVRVRGPAKVMCHLMFGVVSFTARCNCCVSLHSRAPWPPSFPLPPHPAARPPPACPNGRNWVSPSHP